MKQFIREPARRAAPARPTSRSASAARSRSCALLTRKPVRPVRRASSTANPRAASREAPRGGEGRGRCRRSPRRAARPHAAARADEARPSHASRGAASRGGVVWIVVVGVLLAGVVAVNVARAPAERRSSTSSAASGPSSRPTTRCCGSQLSSASANARIERGRDGEARPRAGRPGADDLRPAGAAGEVSERRVEPPDPPAARRLRPRLRRRRSPARRGSRACSHDRFAKMASRQHRETIEIPAGRGTIYDRTGEPLAIGEQATTVYADPRNVADAQRAAVVAGKALGLDAERALPVARRTARKRLRLRRAQGRSGEGGGAREARDPRARLLRRGAALLPAGQRRRARARLRRHRQPRPRRARALARQDARRPARGSRRSSRIPFGRAIDVVTSRPERPGKNVDAHDRPPDPGERRADPRARRCSSSGREGRSRDRDGSAHRRRSSRWRTTRRSTRTASRTAPADARRNRAVTDVYEPGSTFKIVTVAGGARGQGRLADDARSRSPPTIQVADRVIHEAHTPRHRADDASRQILSQSSNVGTITIAQKLGAGELAVVDRPLRLRQADRHRLPGRERGPRAAARRLVGLDDRHRADRAGHRRDAAADGLAPTPRSATAACCVTPHLVEKVGSKRDAAAKAARRVVSEHTADRMMAMFRDVVARGHRHRGRDPRLHGRRQDRHRAEGRERPLRRTSTSPRSSGSCPPRSRGSRSS